MKLPNLLFILIILLILSTRVSLFSGYGRYFFGDEIRYNRLIVTLKDAQKTNKPLLYLQGIFAINARPGYAIFYSPVIWLEKQNRDNMDFIQNGKHDFPYGVLLNVILNSILIFLIFLIINHILGIRCAFLATTTIIFSITSVIYIRHMLPYDASFLVLLLAFYIYLRTNSPYLFGFLIGLSFLIYPSYTYYLIPIPLLMIFFAKKTKNRLEKLLTAIFNRLFKRSFLKNLKIAELALFIVGLALPIIIMELFSRIIGADSYFLTLQQLSSSVAELAQGDFIPAVLFLTEYIQKNDGYWGLMLISSTPLLLLYWHKKPIRLLTIYLVIVFIFLEMFSHIIPKTVLYGRTVRLYYMLLLISSVMVFDMVFKKFSQRAHLPYTLFYILFIIIGFINWWPRFTAMKDLVYPSAIRQQAELYLQQKYINFQLEDVYTKKRSETDTITDPAVLESKKFYLVNPTLLYPYYGNLDAPCQKEIFFESKHPLNFKPYQFEGYTSRMRKYIISDPPKYQLIYCK